MVTLFIFEHKVSVVPKTTPSTPFGAHVHTSVRQDCAPIWVKCCSRELEFRTEQLYRKATASCFSAGTEMKRESRFRI